MKNMQQRVEEWLQRKYRCGSQAGSLQMDDGSVIQALGKDDVVVTVSHPSKTLACKRAVAIQADLANEGLQAALAINVGAAPKEVAAC